MSSGTLREMLSQTRLSFSTLLLASVLPVACATPVAAPHAVTVAQLPTPAPALSAALSTPLAPPPSALAALQIVPAGLTIEVTFTPTTPFIDGVDCFRWPSHCVGALKGGVYLYRPGEVLYYEYMPVGDYAMNVVVTDEKTPTEKHQQTLHVHLGVALTQIAFALKNRSTTMITLRGEATQRYDSRICDGGGSGGTLESSSNHRIVCSVADAAGNTWSMEGSSANQIYSYMQLQMCRDDGVMMRHSQYAATFVCHPADPQSPFKPGAVIEHKAAR
jgi:hypothetical protein